MSRRKQSKPRQIKRSMGDLEEGEENPPDDLSLSGDEGAASDPDDSVGCDSASPVFASLYSEEPQTEDSPGTPDDEEEDKGPTLSADEEDQEEEKVAPRWDGPEALGLRDEEDGTGKVVACQDLGHSTVWGPYAGTVQVEDADKEQEGERPRLTLASKDPECWLQKLPLTSSLTAANCTISSQGEELFCKVTREVRQGESLLATLTEPTAEKASLAETRAVSVKEEPAYPAAVHPEFQLLPQQAGMAAILATAVVNKDIFPCKDCGIWYRSERNLQAHLMYYCASRQKQGAGSPPQDKPKDSYPNERVCPFPHCKKSCPSASSLEIHMRTHSGERPFVCLICLSAFTTKANCERHLKVHTDTLNGICHGCGFVSTTRDILYSHLVTSHMVCQPGSRSEVYSPGPGLPALPQGTGRSPVDSGIVLKCQVCGFAADSPALLQQHVRTHLEVKSPASRQSSPSTGHSEPQHREQQASEPRPDSSSPGSHGTSAAAQEGSPNVSPGPLADVNIKEEPRSDSENAGEEPRAGNPTCQENKAKDASSCTSSPRSPPSVHVKTELPSPTPGSSPVHLSTGGSVLPGGAVFLPQYMFGPEATIMPQASEILAKMSEMVHSRLKQGQSPGSVPAFCATGSPVQKGATCFECDITFNNVNNFYVHKRLYCSSRHQQGDLAGCAPLGKDRLVAPAPPAGVDSSPGVTGSQASTALQGDTEPDGGGATSNPKLVEVKSEDSGIKDPTSSEGESGGRASEGSQSPGGSVEDTDDDPTRTFCQACNIRFSRHDNYMVHKRFYCASRHDPSNQRPHSSKAAFLPQPIRTRKRKKMYEIYMARNEVLASVIPAPAAAPAPAAKQDPVPPLGPSPLPARHLSGPSPSPSPEGDGPIDLSKRPRLRDAPRAGLPALPLTDYHKCTACSISFNSIENYLGHKTFYCPATSLQQRSLEQLHRLRRSASTSPKSRLPERTDAKDSKTDNAGSAAPLSLQHPAITKSPGLPVPPGVKAQVAPAAALPVVCPYCPPNGVVTGDLIEHFKTAHGVVLTLQPALSRNVPEDSDPQSAPVSPSLSPKDPPPATPPRLGPPPHRESVNGRVKREPVSPSSPVVNGSPPGPPKGGLSPPAAAPLAVSPAPEATHPQTVSLLPDKAPLAHTHGASKAALISHPLQNGNTRFCRLCNIKFSSLSTFIAHKKYYCSSHSAEHVK
ncbi:zinc finger protein ZFPM1 isoform X2 [Scleropages formosus]|uniref:Zinc finger protein, FOG family member 1 n=1 Tax=Scleropages formosus TaxID=113540 RepID=A0A8C9SV38_SCLFO|nr:zinc finger protein ZFPM1 isoform X2 [Scleropages formosus]